MKNKRKIFEAPIDEPTGFRINPDLKSAIERGETPLSNSPFIPKKGEDDRQSFEEIAASKRFRDVVTKLERYLGMNVPNNMGGLQMMMMRLYLLKLHSLKQKVKVFLHKKKKIIKKTSIAKPTIEILLPKKRLRTSCQ